MVFEGSLITVCHGGSNFVNNVYSYLSLILWTEVVN